MHKLKEGYDTALTALASAPKKKLLIALATKGALRVSDAARATDLKVSYASTSLSELAKAEVLESRRGTMENTSVNFCEYSLADNPIGEAVRSLLAVAVEEELK